MRDHVIRIDHFALVREFDIAGRDNAFAFLAQGNRDFVAVVQLENDALQVQQQVDHIFLHAVERRIFVHDAGDRHFGRRIANHRRQQHAPKRVTQGVAITAFERLHDHFRVARRQAIQLQ